MRSGLKVGCEELVYLTIDVAGMLLITVSSAIRVLCDSHRNPNRGDRPKASDGAGSRPQWETATMAEDLGIISLETNLADVERPPELPVGRYVGEIQSIETKTSGQGNEYFAMRILIP